MYNGPGVSFSFHFQEAAGSSIVKRIYARSCASSFRQSIPFHIANGAEGAERGSEKTFTVLGMLTSSSMTEACDQVAAASKY